MLPHLTEFPHAGSSAFRIGTGDPVTIIRRNADGTALVRRDPRPLEGRLRDASGNCTVAIADLYETEAAALTGAARRQPRRRARTPRPGSTK